MLHRCICHRFKAAQPKPVRKVNSLNCAVNSIHQPKGNQFFFYSPPFLPLSFWCWATKAYISSPSFCPLSLKVYDVARIERKRELNPSCAKHIYIYIQYSQYSQYTGGKAMEKYESYLCRPTVSFWSRLLSVISDGQTGGWGPCAAQQPAYSSLSSSPVSAIGSIQRVSSANSPDIRECFQIFRKSYYFW